LTSLDLGILELHFSQILNGLVIETHMWNLPEVKLDSHTNHYLNLLCYWNCLFSYI